MVHSPSSHLSLALFAIGSLLFATTGSAQTPLPPVVHPLAVPHSVQAGQLLTLTRAGGQRIAGSVRGAVLTNGLDVPLHSLPGVEINHAAGTVTLRVPPREIGSLQFTFKLSPGPGATPTRESHAVLVTPPNLYDGIRVDGVFDTFESALIAGAAQSGSAQVTMFDAWTLLPASVVALHYEVAFDKRLLYMRVRVEDATEDRQFDLNSDPFPQRFDQISLRFDDNNDGTWGGPDDERIVLPFLLGSSYIDGTANPAAPNDITVDGTARMAWDAGMWTAEFLLPRTPDAAGQDPNFAFASTVPFQIFLGDGLGPQATAPRIGALFPGINGPTASWAALPITPSIPANYADAWTPQAGRLFVISERDLPSGELYEVDLATQTLHRKTFNTRYEDGVSISPNGAFAAYTSAPAAADFVHYEIYKWDAATGSEIPLTNNLTLEGHPAVSPSSATIAFAQYLGPTADISTMLADGTLVAPVTWSPAEENDPEWTKNGLLVIKTGAWTGKEQLAIIDLAGTVLTRLTSNAFSDHDPFTTADNEWILFERYLGPGHWTSDQNQTQASSWPIVAVRLSGAEERTLVEDGLVNWLPVSGPLGSGNEQILYLKNTALNGRELRIVDRFGVDHGRFLPQESHVRYLDWK